jgi:tetratricopeptide (TPR) repeat protein
MRKFILILAVFAIILGTTALFHYTQTYEKVFNRGERYFKDKRYRIALPYFISAYNRTTDDIRPAQYLLQIYEILGEKHNVKDILEVAAQRSPDDLVIRLYLADTYYSLANFAQAESRYRTLYNKDPAPETHRKLAEVLVWQKKYAEAIPLLESLMQKTPRDDELMELLADVYSWVRKYDKSEDLYKKLLSLNVRTKDIALKLADVLRYSGKNEEAIELYDTYINK